jgi:hypothetical protein
VFGKNASARHFPAETLYIVEQQPLKGKAPPEVTSTVINTTRELPGETEQVFARPVSDHWDLVVPLAQLW